MPSINQKITEEFDNEIEKLNKRAKYRVEKYSYHVDGILLFFTEEDSNKLYKVNIKPEDIKKIIDETNIISKEDYRVVDFEDY